MKLQILILSVLILFVSFTTIAQRNQNVIDTSRWHLIDSLIRDTIQFKIDSNFLSSKAFRVYTNRAFGQIATGQNTASLANFGAFEPTNGSFTFNAFAPLGRSDTAKYVPLLSLEAKGDLVSDNISKLFSNSKLNTNVDVTMKLHFPIKPFFKIGFYGSDEDLLFAKKRQLKDDYHSKMKAAKSAYYLVAEDSLKVAWQMNLLHQRISLERDTLHRYRDSVNNTIRAMPVDVQAVNRFTKIVSDTKEQMNGLHKDSVALKSKIDSIERVASMARDTLLHENHWYVLRKGLRDRFEDSLLKLEMTAPVTKVRLAWVSAIFKFNQKKYWFYDTTQVFDKRLSRKPFTGFDIGGELNFYSQKLRSHHAHYLVFGLRSRQDNNLADLSTSTINQKTKSASGSNEREVVKTYSAYTDMIREYRSTFLYINYYFMFKYNNLSAIHIFPEMDARKYKDNEENKSYKNIGLGYIISVKDAKKDKSILNFEAYYKFMDIDNQNELEKGFFERNEIGLRIGFPLNFVIN